MNVERMDIRVRVDIDCGPLLDARDDEWDAWDDEPEEILDFGDVFPCPGSVPSTTQLLDISTKMRDSRRLLKEFSINVGCRPCLQWNPKNIGEASWKISYPVARDDSLGETIVREGSSNPDEASVISLPGHADSFHADSFKLSVQSQHRASECCLASREAELECLRQAMHEVRMREASEMSGEEFSGEEDEELYGLDASILRGIGEGLA
jgi:hypothetical protein